MGLKSWLGIFGVLATVGASAAPALADECERGVVVAQPVAFGYGRGGERAYGRRWDRDGMRFRRFEHRRFERNRVERGRVGRR